jgi:hypothetical protein
MNPRALLKQQRAALAVRQREKTVRPRCCIPACGLLATRYTPATGHVCNAHYLAAMEQRRKSKADAKLRSDEQRETQARPAAQH